jgi:hypothetical protein
MNIFYLHNDPEECAKQHNDKHVVKMILEYAQLLSTAHRVLDGHEVTELTAGGRKIRRWKLESYLDNKQLGIPIKTMNAKTEVDSDYLKKGI